MPLLTAALIVAIAFACGGCSRLAYRLRADADAYRVLQEKSWATPWMPPSDFSVYPSPASRLYAPTCIDDPALPIPAPVLYAYPLPVDEAADSEASDEAAEPPQPDAPTQPLISPIPPAAWDDLPLNCRQLMVEFASLRKEAQLTEERFDRSELLPESEGIPRLDFRAIMELALLNSREYQTQKEALYRTALQLSLERFDYQWKPTAGGNGTDVGATHNRDGGITVNNLATPTAAAVEKTLVTGGDLLARFANSILLTFNGPSGFAADVSSDLLLEFSQPLLQRDIVLEGLTQAERNVVYAARDFARFRKEFFVSFAAQYYGLIRSFRQVEIESQNYFSLVRAFNQAEAEYRAGLVPRFQVDQVEQNLLSGRGGLIGTCNSLEQSLDGLKLDMGLPTETPIQLDLTELNALTQRDQLAVAGKLIERVRRRLQNLLGEPELVELLSTGVVLLDRTLEASLLREQLSLPPLDVRLLNRQRAELQVEAARFTTEEIMRSLESEINSESPSLPVIFQRGLTVMDNLLGLASYQLEFAVLSAQDAGQVDALRQRLEAGISTADGLRGELQRMIEEEELDQLFDLVQRTLQAREQLVQLVRDLDRLNGTLIENVTPPQQLEMAIQKIHQLIGQADELIADLGGGLTPVDIDMDQAMITALVLRLDLLNERGLLADDWRQIKFAADDLRSVLDLNAGQRISTRADVNRPFDFTWDESQTSVQLAFDTPWNRRAQRNRYRFALLDYQRGLRTLMQAEDSIKFAIRNDLRSLALDREQYLIAVASAALAYERVVSTSLEFRLGTGGVSARDYLEAQTAYTDALSAVASRHINYIIDRTQLFLDLELLTLNDEGFWDELYDEEYQPQPYFNFPDWALPVYGRLPCVRHSGSIRRMLCVPPGESLIFRNSEEGHVDDASKAEALPLPEVIEPGQ